MRCLCTARVEGTLLQYTHDRADCQFEVSVLGRVMGCTTEGRLTMFKRLARCLEGTSDAFVWMPMKKWMAVLSLSDTPKATGLVTLEAGRASALAKSLRTGVLLNSFSRRPSVIATGTVEFHAAPVAEHLRVLEVSGLEAHVKIKLESSTAKEIANSEGVGWPSALFGSACVVGPQQAVRRAASTLVKI